MMFLASLSCVHHMLYFDCHDHVLYPSFFGSLTSSRLYYKKNIKWWKLFAIWIENLLRHLNTFSNSTDSTFIERCEDQWLLLLPLSLVIWIHKILALNLSINLDVTIHPLLSPILYYWNYMYNPSSVCCRLELLFYVYACSKAKANTFSFSRALSATTIY